MNTSIPTIVPMVDTTVVPHGPDPDAPKPFAVLAGFATADDLVAARAAAAAGYGRMDTHTPYPVADTADAIGYPKSEMGTVMLIGGLTGVFAGFFKQYWNNAYGYSLNIGGRPYMSWPSFVPIAFEMMVLTASLSGLFGLMALCGLPRLNHPLFNSTAFDRATRDQFFLSIEAAGPKYSSDETRAFLATLNPLSVEGVSLEAGWASTMFPVIFAVNQSLTCFAFCVGVFLTLVKKEPTKSAMRSKFQLDMGSPMLAFALFWSYPMPEMGPSSQP